jgi:hypothetical protein
MIPALSLAGLRQSPEGSLAAFTAVSLHLAGSIPGPASLWGLARHCRVICRRRSARSGETWIKAFPPPARYGSVSTAQKARPSRDAENPVEASRFPGRTITQTERLVIASHCSDLKKRRGRFFDTYPLRNPIFTCAVGELS